ncbi:MAG: UvrD-helicase domain-containing protein [Chlamydiota bacterium]
MKDLNPEQQRAVETTDGRVLILAGAGSGKTSVLAYRICHLIRVKKVDPNSILGLTFTNKAALEMRERVGKMLDKKTAKQITLNTFHSFCCRILRKEIPYLGYTKEFSLYDEQDVKRLTKGIARRLLDHEGDLPSLEQTMSKISFAKSQGSTPESGDDWHSRFTQDLFDKLQMCMRAYNAVDFDSLLSLSVQLFEQFPEVLKIYQEKYCYIMIDEYQDTNPVQYRLAELLAAKHNNLCVVGDDDQSIYGWRGAEVKNILEFSCSTKIKLEQNYRSTPTILNAANSVIKNNQERHQKQLWSNKEIGDPIVMFHAPTDMEEAQSVVQRLIWTRKTHNIPWSDMAILYRSNILARPFEAALMQAAWEKDGEWKKGIPYQVFGGTEFAERSEIKDLIAFLKVIANPLDQEALLRIINVPRRGISEQTLDCVTQINRKENKSLWDVLKGPLPSELSERAISGIQRFVALIQTAQEKFKSATPMKETFQWLIEEINYKKAIMEEVKSDKMRAFKWENVAYCLDALGEYEQEEENPSLSHFLENTLLDQERFHHAKKDVKEDKVSLMTFHSAKGLEFSACFLVCLEDHIIPHEKSAEENGIEEERRLMYVAMTRAKKHLTLSMARCRKRYGKEMNSTPSSFLFEIPKELIKITSHQTLG